MPNSLWGTSASSAAATASFTDLAAGGAMAWGSIGGTLSAQGDLVAALNARGIWGSISGASSQAAPAGGWTGALALSGVGTLPGSSWGGIYKTATGGFILAASAGSTNDFMMVTPTGSLAIMTVPTGTNNMVFGGSVSMGALTATSGAFSGNLNCGAFFSVNTTTGNSSFGPYAVSMGALTATSGAFSGNLNCGAFFSVNTTTGNSSFGPYAVSMGALTATSGAFSGAVSIGVGSGVMPFTQTVGAQGWQIGPNAGVTASDATWSVYSNVWGPAHSYIPIFQLDQTPAGYIGGAMILTLGNVGTNAATLQAAVASATAPKVGTHAQMVAYSVPAGTTPYWYATDDTETDGLLGKLWQWSGSAWVAVGTPSTIVGRVTAGVISAGAVGAQAIAADVALIGQTLRNTGFTAGTSSVAPSGFKFSGTAFTATLLDGTTLSVFGELGADLSIGGLKAAVIANRVKGNLFYRNTAGTTDVFVPDGVVSIEVTLQATGGNGASSYGTGGAGGQYIKAMVTVKPHNTYRLTLGAAGSNSTFTWVSFDGTSGFTTDSSAVNFSAACGAAGSSGSGTGAQGADIGFSFPGPESSWNIGGAAGGDNLAAGAVSAAGRGGNIYGLGSGGSGGGTTATKQGGGGGGASATGNGGGGGMNPANGLPGTSGGGGGGGATGGAGGVGFVRAKW